MSLYVSEGNQALWFCNAVMSVFCPTVNSVNCVSLSICDSLCVSLWSLCVDVSLAMSHCVRASRALSLCLSVSLSLCQVFNGL
jgi:hypothetical protein